MPTQHDAVFVSPEVRDQVEKAMALIADAANDGGGMIRLDVTAALMRRAESVQPPPKDRYELLFSPFGTAVTRPFLVRDRVLKMRCGRWATLDEALAHYPNAVITEEAINAHDARRAREQRREKGERNQ